MQDRDERAEQRNESIEFVRGERQKGMPTMFRANAATIGDMLEEIDSLRAKRASAQEELRKLGKQAPYMHVIMKDDAIIWWKRRVLYYDQIPKGERTMSDELKPCAHCGESAELCCPSGLSWWVRCSNTQCGMATKIAYSPEPVVAAWNRRADAAIAKRENTRKAGTIAAAPCSPHPRLQRANSTNAMGVALECRSMDIFIGMLAGTLLWRVNRICIGMWRRRKGNEYLS